MTEKNEPAEHDRTPYFGGGEWAEKDKPVQTKSDEPVQVKPDGAKSTRSLFEKAQDWYMRGFSRAVEEFSMRREGLRQFEELPNSDRVKIGIFGAIRELAVQAIRFASLPFDAAFSLLDEIEHPISKDYVLGFGWTEVKGNGSATINVQPQVSFHPERLVIPSTVAKDFLVTDVKIGPNSQLVSTGAVPALAFSEQTSCNTNLQFDACGPDRTSFSILILRTTLPPPVGAPA